MSFERIGDAHKDVFPEELVKLAQLSIYDKTHTDESVQSLMGFRLKPRYNETVDLTLVKKMMHTIHQSNLDGKKWKDLDPKIICTTISNEINDRVKDLCQSIREDHRYKCVVQTNISKMNLQGVTKKTGCLWDLKTDKLISEIYINEHLLCCSEVIIIFYY